LAIVADLSRLRVSGRTSMARRTVAAIAAGSLLITLWGCGASATPIPSAAAQSATAASEAPASVEPSTAPASTEPSAAAASEAAPGFSLPSEAKDLEALLPNTLCGAAAQKASVSGSSIGSTAGPEFTAALSALGKSVSDVTFALAFSASGCGAGIFRIAGVDQSALQTAMLASVQKSGESYTQANVGGKDVYVSASSSGSGKQYVYFKGDAVIFASAPDDTKAAGVLQSLP
jgi:hypothetical protein